MASYRCVLVLPSQKNVIFLRSCGRDEDESRVAMSLIDNLILTPSPLHAVLSLVAPAHCLTSCLIDNLILTRCSSFCLVVSVSRNSEKWIRVGSPPRVRSIFPRDPEGVLDLVGYCRRVVIGGSVEYDCRPHRIRVQVLMGL